MVGWKCSLQYRKILHSQKEKLKLCRFSTYIEILCFVHRRGAKYSPHTSIQCSSFLLRFEVVFAHTIIGIVTHFLCGRYTLNKITLEFCYACRSRYILYIISLFFLPECTLLGASCMAPPIAGVYTFWESNNPPSLPLHYSF